MQGRWKSTTPTSPDDPPSSRRREASLLPSKPQRPSHLANFLMFLVENLLSASFFPRALGSVLSALAPTCVQCAEGQHAKSVENRFARHEKFDYLTLLELLKVAPSCRCARRSRHPRGMPLRGGTDWGSGGTESPSAPAAKKHGLRRSRQQGGSQSDSSPPALAPPRLELVMGGAAEVVPSSAGTRLALTRRLTHAVAGPL